MKKVVIIFLFLLIFPVSASAKKTEIKFVSCVDGDTIKVKINGRTKTIRFLAIDTPEVRTTKESDPFGDEAKEYTCNMVQKAKKLELESDPNSSKTDKYERVLGWIYADDVLIQKRLVSKGYAKVTYLYGDYLYTDELKKLESQAKGKKIGIWSLEENNIDNIEKSSNKSEKSLTDTIKKEVNEYLKNLVDDIFKKLKKTVKKKINNLLN